MLAFAIDYPAPIALRYPRGNVKELPEFPLRPIQAGKAQILREFSSTQAGPKVAVLAIGAMVKTALQVSDQLLEQGVNAAVADLRFVKPLDESLLLKWGKEAELVAILEDGIMPVSYTHLLSFVSV